MLLRQAIHSGSEELQEKAELRLLEWKSEDGRKMNVGRRGGSGEGCRWATIRGRLIVHDVLLLYRNKVPDQRHLFSHHGETCLTHFLSCRTRLPFNAVMILWKTGFDVSLRLYVRFCSLYNTWILDFVGTVRLALHCRVSLPFTTALI